MGGTSLDTGRDGRILRPALIGALAVTAIGFALFAASAQAIQTHVFLKSFGSGHLNQPIGLAVDNSSTPSQGAIYIANQFSPATVQKYDSSGNLITSFGDTTPSPDGQLHGTALPGGAFSEPFNVAVDPSNGDLYVVDRGGANTVDKFDSSGNLITSFGDTTPSPDGQLHGTAAGGFSPWALSVDPSTHNLYVGDIVGQKVDVFDSSGAFQASLSFAGAGYTINVALDSLGHVYVANAGAVLVYDASTGNLDSSYGGGSGTLLSGASNGLAVDPITDHVYVGQDGFISEWDSSGNLVNSFGADASPALGHELYGVTVDAVTQRIYVADYEQSLAYAFTPLLKLPTIVTDDASNIGQTTATVNGNVDPDAAHGGGPVTDCHFEYGTDTTYSLGSVLCSEATPYSAPIDVSADLSGLTPETTYHYRLVAANANGHGPPGADHTFTPRAVYSLSTGAPSNPEPGSATLTGSFTGDGNDTHYYFEYVDLTHFDPTAPDPYNAGQTTAAPPGADAGSGTGTQNVSAIAHLSSPYTEYHYRIVATNSFGTSYGSDQTLFSSPPILPIIDATSASKVTPISATLDAQVNPGFGPTSVRFEYGTTSSYGSRTYPSDSIGNDNAEHPASADITGLTPGTTYHFRALATNFSGITRGSDQTVSTPALPAVGQSAATDVTQTTATLSASIRPGFRATTYRFEYGRTDSYGSNTPESVLVGYDNSVHPAPATISALSAGTTYHYRIIATNAIGTTTAPDQAFTTAPLTTPPPPPRLTCKRGFVKRQGKCRKVRHRKPQHHRRTHQ